VESEGQVLTCTLRGTLKKEKNQFKNLVTVGDFVLFERSGTNDGLIAHVEPSFRSTGTMIGQFERRTQ